MELEKKKKKHTFMGQNNASNFELESKKEKNRRGHISFVTIQIWS